MDPDEMFILEKFINNGIVSVSFCILEKIKVFKNFKD